MLRSWSSYFFFSYFFSFVCHVAHRLLHSFPTRRSSDLHGDLGRLQDHLLVHEGHFGRRAHRHRALSDVGKRDGDGRRSEEHTSELQSPCNLVCRLLLEKKKPEKLQEVRSK